MINQTGSIHAKELSQITVNIYEPFAEFLLADPDEYRFTISLLDVVRFAGHACPSMIGAFLISQRAIAELFPETNTCVRGQVGIEIPAPVTQGPTGPISNVFSMIFGSWEKSGFGGLQGKFVRRGLLKYEASNIPLGTYRFHNLISKVWVDITYDPTKVPLDDDHSKISFQDQWRRKITTIIRNPASYVFVVGHSS
jgi:hypothetical protein